MEKKNSSTVPEFTLVGLSDLPELSIFLFLVFLLIYGITVMGNVGMITVIQASSQLHIPMYFCLSHLCFVDFCYSTTIVPKKLANILSKEKTISFLGCMVQLCLFGTCAIMEVILLTVMAYDCFVTVCYPLLYMVIMSQKLCMGLVTACYICGAGCSLVYMSLVLEIPFFCNLLPIFSLACSDVSMNKLVVYIVATFNEIITITIILTSSLFILITILRMRSAEGRCKALSTCASHRTAIVVFHGTILSIYCRPSSDYSLETDKVFTVFYTLVIPMLNPLICSLREKDVKAALRKMVRFKLLFEGPIP